MSKRIAIPELRQKLLNAIELENQKIIDYTGELNPQIIELKHVSEGRKQAFQAVLESLQGDLFLLNMYSKENTND